MTEWVYLFSFKTLAPSGICFHFTGQIIWWGKGNEKCIDLWKQQQPLQNEFPEFLEFLGIPIYSKTCKWRKIKTLEYLEFMGIIGNCENTNENLWEFLGILNNSTNFKINLGTLAYFRKNNKCSKVMNSLRILIIISLIADNKKDFLTLTSIKKQH